MRMKMQRAVAFAIAATSARGVQPRPSKPELADGSAGDDERRRRHRARHRSPGSVRGVVRQFRLHGRPRHRRIRVDERGADLDQRRRAGRGAVGHRRSPTTCSTRCIERFERPTTCSPARTLSPRNSMPAREAALRALAFALKAEALGEALQSYQKIPIKTYGVTAPVYVARAEALAYVRALLDSADGNDRRHAAKRVLQRQYSDAGRESDERHSAVPRAVCAHGE